MKIKGSQKNLKINSAFAVSLAGTVLALILRLYQAFSGLIDFETGFFTQNSFTTPLLYGVLGVTAVTVFVMCLLAGEVPQDKLPSGRNIPVAVLSLVFAVFLVVGATNAINSFMQMSDSYNIMFTEQTKMSYLMKSGALPRLGEGAFAVFSAIYFIALTLKYSFAKDFNFAKFKFLTLCPLFWAIFRMIQRFTRTISFMNVSDLFLELFMIAFMMMFFMYLAQISAEVNNRAISYKVTAYGLIAGMFAAVVSLPKVVLCLFDTSYKSLMEADLLECPLEIADITFCLFVFVFIGFWIKGAKIKNMTLKETEELIEEEN